MIEDKLLRYFKKDGFKGIDKRLKAVILTTFISGLLAHGMVIFNEYAICDNVSHMFDVGFTITSGRWFLHFAGRFIFYFFGGLFALPIITGVTSLFYLGSSAYLVIQLLDLKKISSCVLTTAVMIMFPTIVSLFFYNFTASYYTFAILLISIGVYIVCKKRKLHYFLCGSFLISCGVGIYQAFIPYAIGLLVLYFIKETDEHENEQIVDYIKNAFYLVASCIVFMAMYFLCLKFALWYYHLQLTDYQGINGFGLTSFKGYLNRIMYTFAYFLHPKSLRNGWENSMFPMRLSFLYYIEMLITTILCFQYVVLKIVNKQVMKAIFFLAGIVALLFASNLIFIICEPYIVHSLMLYGEVTLIIFAILIFEKINEQINIPKILAWVGLIVLFLFPVYYCHYDNVCYLKLDLTQNRYMSYCNSLVTQIKSIPGYKDEYEVAYIEPLKIKDNNVVAFEALEQVNINPVYDTSEFMRNSYIAPFLNTWCAYSPKAASEEELKMLQDLPEVKAMPCYPDDGSIKIINNIVVVKFGNPDK